MKETFIKKWESNSVLGFNSSEEIPKFTNYDISESNMRCDIFIKEMWHEMSNKIKLLMKLHFLVRALNKPDIIPREEFFGHFIPQFFDTNFTSHIAI